MKHMNCQVLEQLTKQKQEYSVSIYLSSFKDTRDATNAQKLSNQLREAEKQLLEKGMNQKEVENYLNPVKDLLADSSLLYQIWEGIAIFLNNDFFEYYIIQGIQNNFTYTGNEFYVLPLLGVTAKNLTYYILCLSLHGVHLYKGDKNDIRRIEIESFVPQKLENAPGWQDYKNEMYRHEGAHMEKGIKIQGQFRGGEENKKEIEEFLRIVDGELLKVIKNKGIPLIIESVDYIFYMYKRIASYHPILEEHLSENPKGHKPHELKEKAWDIIQSYYDKEKNEAIKYFQEVKNKSDIPEEIVYNTYAGRTDILFVNNEAMLWGSYDEINNQVRRNDKKQAFDVELVNFTAIKAIARNSNVFLLDNEEMPQPGIEMAAIYRY